MSKTVKQLMDYLFVQSPVEEELAAFPDDVAAIYEEMDEIETRAPSRSVLKSVLKELGVDVSEDTLGLCHDTWQIVMDDEDKYIALKELVLSPETQDKLADKGWVAYATDNSSTTDEGPTYRIKFLDLNTPDISTGEGDADLDKLVGKAREDNGFGGEPSVKDPVSPEIKESAMALVNSLLEGDRKDQERVTKIKKKTERKLAKRFGPAKWDESRGASDDDEDRPQERLPRRGEHPHWWHRPERGPRVKRNRETPPPHQGDKIVP